VVIYNIKEVGHTHTHIIELLLREGEGIEPTYTSSCSTPKRLDVPLNRSLILTWHYLVYAQEV